MNISYEYMETKVRPSYGGKTIEAVYTMTHVKNSRTNKYRITATIGGIQSRDPYFQSVAAEFIGDMETDSNDETLTSEAAAELFEQDNER
jgi:hypothetical protein